MFLINILLLHEFNKVTSKNFAAGLKQANLASKTYIPDITDFVKKDRF